MAIQSGVQPEIRFHHVGPNSLAGVSYLPKTILVKKVWGTTTENDDFMTLPTGAFIVHAYAVCTVGTASANVQISLGQDGATTSLIAYTNFTCQTAGQATAYTGSGIYLSAGDTLRVTVAGTGAAAGEAVFILQYFEVPAMISRGAHLDT
jgi:hypothetical protein